MTFGSLLTVCCFAALARVQSVAALYLIWIGLGLAMAATLYEPAFAVITQLFGPRYRRAITVLTLWGGLASTVFWPLAAWLLQAYGWRATALWLAGANVFCFAVHALLLPRAQGTGVTHSSATGAPLPLRTLPFIALATALLAQAIVITALSLHLLPILTGRGLSLGQAAAIGAIFGPAQVAGRVLEMAISPRASAIATGRVVTLCLPLAVALLLAAGDQFVALIGFALLYGLGNGMMTIVRGAAPVELWGRENYGALMGWLALPATLARASGPLLASLVLAAAGGYATVLLLLISAGVVAVIAFYLAGRGRR
jgi:predicted MFS family arabinose efflux permease